MVIPELISIIKKKRLYKGACFEIAVDDPGKGDYASESWRVIAGVSQIASESEGIYRENTGTWKYFRESDRGEKIFFPENYSESEACQKLLEYMISENEMGKLTEVGIKFPERWFKTDTIEY
jgi:hypothetical protein